MNRTYFTLLNIPRAERCNTWTLPRNISAWKLNVDACTRFFSIAERRRLKVRAGHVSPYLSQAQPLCLISRRIDRTSENGSLRFRGRTASPRGDRARINSRIIIGGALCRRGFWKLRCRGNSMSSRISWILHWRCRLPGPKAAVCSVHITSHPHSRYVKYLTEFQRGISNGAIDRSQRL